MKLPAVLKTQPITIGPNFCNKPFLLATMVTWLTTTTTLNSFGITISGESLTQNELTL